MQSIDKVLTRGVAQILPNKRGLAELMAQKKITLYQGFDPSMPSLHLGNYVGLMKLRQFQQLGHKVIFLVGDFTGMIGDPDKMTARKPLTRGQIKNNIKNWREQAGRVLDFEGKNKARIVFNYDWNSKLSIQDVLNLCSKITYQQLIKRNMFQKRIEEDRFIYMHELLYPIFQGYDSVFLNVDLEIGGNDQMFNMMIGRDLVRATKNKEKYVLTTKLLVDKEGNKVGKTTGNALFLDSTSEDFYAGMMSFPDEVIALGFELLTEVDLNNCDEKIKKNPLGEKKRLASEVVKILWGQKASQTAQAQFEQTFQKRRIPTEIPTMTIKNQSLALLDLVFASKKVGSRSEAKRLIAQKAIEIDGKTEVNPTKEIEIPNHGLTLKIGKKTFVKMKRP